MQKALLHIFGPPKSHETNGKGNGKIKFVKQCLLTFTILLLAGCGAGVEQSAPVEDGTDADVQSVQTVQKEAGETSKENPILLPGTSLCPTCGGDTVVTKIVGTELVNGHTAPCIHSPNGADEVYDIFNICTQVCTGQTDDSVPCPYTSATWSEDSGEDKIICCGL